MSTNYADEKHRFFEGKIFVRFTAKDLVIDIEGVSDLVSQDDLKLAITEAVCRHLEDNIPEDAGA